MNCLLKSQKTVYTMQQVIQGVKKSYGDIKMCDIVSTKVDDSIVGFEFYRFCLRRRVWKETETP